MTRIGIILGSTRPGRKGEQVASWVQEVAGRRDDAEFELVDLADFPLPAYDEPIPPMAGRYAHDHTQRWARRVGSLDGFVMITPEYNHSTTAVLKNALDYVFAEWNNKAVGFVSYGAHGGVRAVEHLRAIAGELMLAGVRAQVVISLYSDFRDRSAFEPKPQHEATLHTMLDQVIAWTDALAPLRAGAS